jgi:acyl-coenzyme A synthetase/AMP-(fatty) acid ligase
VVRGEDGLLRFRGRDDAMIKVSGNRISPTEIEEAALASGAVSDVAAFGVPDERLGQSILLVAVAKIDAAEERLRTYLRRELPPHMQPQHIVWKDRLPVGPNGKLDRTALKAEIA